MTERPCIWIERSDYSRLLALPAEVMAPEVSSLLAEELGRAIVRAADDLPAAVVRMGDRIMFRRDSECEPEWGQLVFPEHACGAGNISVTSPLGAAMIGLRAGARMSYRDADNQQRCLVIERVIRG